MEVGSRSRMREVLICVTRDRPFLGRKRLEGIWDDDEMDEEWIVAVDEKG